MVTLFVPGLPGIHLGGRSEEELGPLLGFLPLILVGYRLIVGLAKVSDPLYAAGTVELAPTEGSTVQTDRGVRLGRVWAEGKKLALVAFGLWAMLLMLLFGAMLILIGPVVALVKVLGLGQFSALSAGLLAPVMLLILAYAAVLMVLNQLALHSLAHNHRGVASALTHAWRLVRASPLGALRATAVDLVLFLSVLMLDSVLHSFLGPNFLRDLVSLATLLLYGFAGVTRAGFWARTYRALGGLSSADRVPGL